MNTGIMAFNKGASMKAQNIFLDENTGGKGRYFKARFLQPGLVKYSFGVCLLEKETIDKFIYEFVGCPVIIGHNDVTSENAKQLSAGNICHIWYDQMDGWYWGDGIIDEQEALNKIEEGYNVSCQYEITEYSNNTEGKLHNGNPYDKIILNGKPEHLAIVDRPRYENAMIAVNAMDKTEATMEAKNGWITKYGDDGEPIRIYIEGYYRQSRKEFERKLNILEKFKEGQETKYDFTHTRAKVTPEQERTIKKIVNNVLGDFVSKPIAQVEIRSLEGGALGLCTSINKASMVGLDSKLFSGKLTQEQWERSIDKGFHPKTDNKDMLTCVLTHELGHSISVNTDSKEFWKDIEKVRSEYLKNITREDVKNPDFISNYARTNKFEFVAEAFSQGQLSKKYGKYTKDVMDIIEKHLSKSKQLKIAASNKSTDDLGYWEEDFGGGYPIDEEAYEEFKQLQKKEQKEAEKQDKAKNCIIQAINEIKETDMFKKLFNKKEKTMDKDEMKSLFMECIQDVLKAQNEEDKKDDDKEDKKEDKDLLDKEAENKCKNESVDKRDIIRQIMAIAGKEEASEDVKTIAKLAEKLAYDKSEAKTADNKCKNEDEEDDKKEEDKEAENKKAQNSIEEIKSLLTSLNAPKSSSKYVTKSQAIELGDKLFG